MSDPVDNASRLIERESQAREAGIRKRMREAESAPVNRSGRCGECDDPIDPRRLAKNPRAALCVDCQTDHEQRARHWRA